MARRPSPAVIPRRRLLQAAGLGAAWPAWRQVFGQASRPGTIIDFEEKLAAMRAGFYRRPPVDIIQTGFRPVGGRVADFGTAAHEGRYHFFYIERRLQEGTPFYPGHEAYFGHASTADLFEWEVHEPVMWVRPGTWEGAHVWAPCVIRHGEEYLMAYTGVSAVLSQDIGLAFSRDLFNWRRCPYNPISPCRDRPWAFWRTDGIASCRDPDLFRHDGRLWMTYTANTREGATCIALCSTTDLRSWEDHGPIVVGPSDGYEPRLEGGHPQGSFESAKMFHKRGRWFLTLKAAVRDTKIRCWIIESDRLDRFDFKAGREFWSGSAGVEVVRERGDRSLLASFGDGHIRFGETDWSADRPVGRFITSAEELRAWTT